VPNRATGVPADIVPEIEDHRPVSASSVDPESRRALVIEAAASRAALLALDDLQWRTRAASGRRARARPHPQAHVGARLPMRRGPAGRAGRGLPGRPPEIRHRQAEELRTTTDPDRVVALLT